MKSILSCIYVIVAMIIIGSCTSNTKTNMDDTMTIEVNQGTNMAAALSPDGQQLAIDLQGVLWLLSADGGEATPITDIFGDTRQPTWSNDGTKIAFQAYWEGNWHIYTIEPDGKNMQQITQDDFDHREPAWSPNDNQLAFSSDRAGHYDIWSYSFDNEEMTRITETSANEFAPTWSPDQATIAYISDQNQQSQLVIQQLTEGTKKAITTNNDYLLAPTWSKDGEHIFMVGQTQVSSVLIRYEIETGMSTLLSEPNEDVFPFRPSFIDNSIIYTSDGHLQKLDLRRQEKNRIPFSASFELNRPDYEQKVMVFDGNEDFDVKGILEPTIAPDGEQIAFVALADLFIHQNGINRQITDDPFIQKSPAWSNAGDQLAFVSDMDGQSGIYIYDVATGETNICVETDGLVGGLDWSAADDEIIYNKNFHPRLGVLRRVNINTKEVETVGSPLPYSISKPSFTSDGKHVGFTVLQPYSKLYREGINRLVIRNIESGATTNFNSPRHKSFGTRETDGPDFSLDGKLAVSTGADVQILEVGANGQSTAITESKSIRADRCQWQSNGTLLCTDGSDLFHYDLNQETRKDIDLSMTYKFKTPGISYTVRGATIWTGDSTLRDHQIIVTGNRIESIQPNNNPAVGDIIDATGKYIIPGLIDVHAHQGSGDGYLLGHKWLAWGITSTRDPSTDPIDALNRREAQRSGHLLSPRVFFTGSPFDGNRVYYGGTYAQQSEEQLQREIGKIEALDYDLVKTYVRLSDKWQKQVIEAAHRAGVPVTSHELFPAVAYGIDGVEHIMGTSRRGYSPKMTGLLRSYGDVTDLIAKSGMWFTPTIAIYVGYKLILATESDFVNDPRTKALEDEESIFRFRSFFDEEKDETIMWQKQFERAAGMIRDIHEKGGLVVAGTDSPIIPFGLGLHTELLSYQMAGLTPIEVLKTATTQAARVLGTDEIGRLTSGNLADFLILNDDPSEDIRNAKNIDRVVLNGNMMSVSELITLEAPEL